MFQKDYYRKSSVEKLFLVVGLKGLDAKDKLIGGKRPLVKLTCTLTLTATSLVLSLKGLDAKTNCVAANRQSQNNFNFDFDSVFKGLMIRLINLTP
jgi:hypothetical protein